MSNGIILWEGPSRFNGEPIVVIATGLQRVSKNPKTGPMIQVWILEQEHCPVDGSKEQTDEAICGGCPLKRSIGGGCYVTLHQAPQQVWRHYKAGAYPRAGVEHMGLFTGRNIRLGAYGDPSAAPLSLWQSVLYRAAGWSAYTHSYATAEPGLEKICMASVHGEHEARRAQTAGWRTFRIKDADEPLMPREFSCPASAEGGHRKTCSECLACDGSWRGTSKASVAIEPHGHLVGRFA